MTEEFIDRFLEVRRALAPKKISEKTALLVIDMQNYQVRRDWPLYKFLDQAVPGLLDYYVDMVSEVAEPNIKRLIEVCRKKKIKIIYTMYSSFSKDGGDLPRHIKALNDMVRQGFSDVMFPHKDHPGSRIIDSLKPEEEDLVVVKNTSGVFTSTELEFILRNMGIEQVLVAGVVTNMCVENAARIASDTGFGVVVVDDACAAWSPEVHRHSLRSFEMVFGHVMKTDEVIERIKSGS